MTSKLTITREQATDKEIQMLIDSHENGTAMFLLVDAYYLMAKELQERRKAAMDSEPVALTANIERDAQRYRFLRERDAFGDDGEPGLASWDDLIELETNDFDAAIDARMAHPSVDFLTLDNALQKHERRRCKDRNCNKPIYGYSVDGLCEDCYAAVSQQPAPECEQLAIENFRSAMEGIGHIRRTLEETFGGLHGTHVEPDVLAECKAICDATYAAYRHAQPVPAVMDETKLRELFDSWFASDCSFDLSPEASESDNIAWRESYWYVWKRCRAAMLQAGNSPVLTVWYGDMPETNGKTNWTAILHRKGECLSTGITIDRSEYPDRVRYEADRMRHLIGELADEPDILAYDAEAHSGYVYPGNSPVIPDGYRLQPISEYEAMCATVNSDEWPQRWIPVSEQMPEVGDIVLTAMGGVVNVGETECSAANCRFFTSVISGRELPATHWMPLPAAPQEVK